MTGPFDAATIDRDGIFAPLTRTELDTLLTITEQAYYRAETRLMQVRLTEQSGSTVYDAAGLAADCWWAWNQALMESIHNLWHVGSTP